MTRLPVEGVYVASTYRSAEATAIVALFAREPRSFSAFHRLAYDEIWHYYGGDPFRLLLLFPDGTSRDVVMGQDIAAGQHVQFTVPAGTWQAGDILDEGSYALFGCTMAPGFTADCFEAATADTLVSQWPARAADIARYAVANGGALHLSDADVV